MDVDLEKCEFYVQVSGLPLVNDSIASATIVGNVLEKFVHVDEDWNKGRIATAM